MEAMVVRPDPIGRAQSMKTEGTDERPAVRPAVGVGVGAATVQRV